MISVVVCSVNVDHAKQLKQSIDESIGVPWELILIDNAKLKKGITHVYNLGASRAKFDFICFVHEDVIFRTNDWGKLMLSYFTKNPNLGLVGLAGARYKSRTPSGWWTGISSVDCCNILNIFEDGIERRVLLTPDASSKLQTVAIVDGVLLFTKKTVWQEVRFSEELDGFHFYDIDFSFRVAAKYECAVTFEIDLLHLKLYGYFDKIWASYGLPWHALHSDRLPLNVGESTNLKRLERTVARNWLHRLRFEKLDTSDRLRWISASGSWKQPALWVHIMVFLFPRASRTIAQKFRNSQ